MRGVINYSSNLKNKLEIRRMLSQKPRISKTSYIILLLAGVICMMIVGAGALVKTKDDQVKLKSQEILSLFQANPKVPDTKPYEAFHEQGLSLATSILMSKAEQQGDLAERDRLFTEAYQRFSDVELSTLMFGNHPLFSELERHSRLKRAEDAAVKNPQLAKAMTLSSISTIPDPVQARMEACYQVLAQKYLSSAGSTPVARMAWDGFFETRSCKS
jgi:hypothetical protein